MSRRRDHRTARATQPFPFRFVSRGENKRFQRARNTRSVAAFPTKNRHVAGASRRRGIDRTLSFTLCCLSRVVGRIQKLQDRCRRRQHHHHHKKNGTAVSRSSQACVGTAICDLVHLRSYLTSHSLPSQCPFPTRSNVLLPEIHLSMVADRGVLLNEPHVAERSQGVMRGLSAPREITRSFHTPSLREHNQHLRSLVFNFLEAPPKKTCTRLTRGTGYLHVLASE